MSSDTNCDESDGSVVQPTPSSADVLVSCPYCPQARFFKGNRGLRIHFGRVHKSQNVSSCPESSSIPQSFPQTTNLPLWQKLSNLKNSVPVLKRVPRGARPSVACHLAKCVRFASRENTVSAWEQLLTFPYKILHVQKNLANKKSLTAQIKDNCNFSIPTFDPKFPSQKHHTSGDISRIVQTKLSEGDIRGAAKILFSGDEVAPCSSETLSALECKHPIPGDNLTFPDPPDPNLHTFQISVKQLVAAIGSFRSGSAGGLDGLTPQHLKDLTGPSAGEAGESLLRELTALTNLMLAGKVHEGIIDTLYGANLCALRKRDGGIRPIAVGSTYRRTAAKICCKYYSRLLSEKFQPLQLGFGSKGGCEAAVHALSTFLAYRKNEVILKVDVKNAFNSVNRDTLLAEVKSETPKIYSFLWQCYRNPSKLVYKDNLLNSAVGCQQGDPLGPVIFSLAIHPIIRQLKSNFNVWYLDDGTLGGDVNTIAEDFITLKTKFHSLGLDLNTSKCEIYIPNNQPEIDRQSTLQKIKSIAPEIKLVDNSSLRLLGSPILEESYQHFIDDKIQNFQSISDRLFKISLHSAITLIRFCCFGPKFTYFLRSSRLWKHLPLLEKVDQIIRSTLTSILNVSLDDRAWSQATLPIRFGGLGVRKVSSLGLPAFLSSVHSTEQLIREILRPSLVDCQIMCLTEAVNSWKLSCPGTDLPEKRSSQRQWDGPLCSLIRKELIDTSINTAERARLLAVGEWESGLWLQALPSTNLGTMLDSNAFRLAISLRLGIACVASHLCQCGETVDCLGHHGLSCSRSAGRISRHANLNDIIRRALVTAGVPAVLEPNGLVRSDGKRPDGMSLLPWKLGRPLVWDATCVDTLAPSHVLSSAAAPGAAAGVAETLKRRKYNNLTGNYIFEPFGVETFGTWGPGARVLFKELAKRLVDSTRDHRAGIFLGQRISIAIQRGNAASLLGTFPVFDKDDDEFFDACY